MNENMIWAIAIVALAMAFESEADVKLAYSPRPACGERSPRFCAARLAVDDLDATRGALKNNGVDFQVTDGVLLIAPAASHGMALEFVEQGTI